MGYSTGCSWKLGKRGFVFSVHPTRVFSYLLPHKGTISRKGEHSPSTTHLNLGKRRAPELPAFFIERRLPFLYQRFFQGLAWFPFCWRTKPECDRRPRPLPIPIRQWGIAAQIILPCHSISWAPVISCRIGRLYGLSNKLSCLFIYGCLGLGLSYLRYQ